jgi:hypothetical protein
MKMKMNVCFFCAKLGHLVNFFQEKIILIDFFKKIILNGFQFYFFQFLQKLKIKMAISKMDPI